MPSPRDDSDDVLPDRDIVTARTFGAPRERVFEAFSDPVRLARWWGPKGFTNTFHEFDLRPGGSWRFLMHGPGGAEFPNESVFVEVVTPERIVFRHLSGHLFEMTMTFAEQGGGTRLTWRMRHGEELKAGDRPGLMAVAAGVDSRCSWFPRAIEVSP